jgi:hypothetical protein
MPKMTDDQIRDRTLVNIVKSLREFGYPHADKRNVITDEVYSRVFESQLNEVMGMPKVVEGSQVHRVVSALLKDIAKAKSKREAANVAK